MAAEQTRRARCALRGSSLAALAAALFLAGGGPAAATLSPAARAIVDRVAADNRLEAICSDRNAVADAVRAATRALLRAGVLSGNPRPDAEAAGRSILADCGRR